MTNVSPPMTSTLTGPQYISIHTVKGVPIDQFAPSQQFSVGWGRAKNNTSKCSLNVTSGLTLGRVPDLVPWQHQVSVFAEDQTLLWTGPLVDWDGNRDQLTISAEDLSAHFGGQATPLTKDWEAADPGVIASELIKSTLEQQEISTAPIVRTDPRVAKFDFSTEFESGYVEQDLARLVDSGLVWSVVSGVPVLGPVSFKIQAALSENDFVGGSPVVGRRGKDMATEIILRAPTTIARSRRRVPGIHRQRIIDVEDMHSVSHAQAVVDQYVRETSRVRTVLRLPGNIQLHPQAPVTLAQLVPTARFSFSAYGLLEGMELTAMEFSSGSEGGMVKVSLQSYNDEPPELEAFAQNSGLGGLLGGEL